MKKLTLSDKLVRLRARLHDREWRRYGMLLLGGKLMSLGLLVMGIMFINPGLVGFRALAADPTLTGNDIVNPINTVCTLVAAFLVFGMQVGFTMLEAGFCRSRETVNVLMECIVDTCLCGILFYAWGFAFIFSHGNGLIGYHWFFLKDVPATYEATGVAFLAFWLFQFAFADTCSTITSGSMIGRTGFAGALIYSVGVSGFIYPIIGHWAGDQMVSWRPWEALAISCHGSEQGFTILPVPQSSIRSVASLQSRVPLFSDQDWAAPLNVMAVALSCLTISRSRPAADCYCGLVGTDLIPEALCLRWILRASEESPQIQRLRLAPPV